MTASIIAAGIVTYVAVSLPVAIFVGKIIARTGDDDPVPARATEPETTEILLLTCPDTRNGQS